MEKLLTASRQGWDWLAKDTHKQKAAGLPAQLCRAFTEHPREAGESYLEHFLFTAGMATRLFYSAAVLLVHGILPCTFTRTASKQVEIIYSIMKSRIPKARREELDGYGDGI